MFLSFVCDSYKCIFFFSVNSMSSRRSCDGGITVIYSLHNPICCKSFSYRCYCHQFCMHVFYRIQCYSYTTFMCYEKICFLCSFSFIFACFSSSSSFSFPAHYPQVKRSMSIHREVHVSI